MAGTSIWRPKSISQTNASVFVSARLARSLAPPAVTRMKKQTGQIQKDPNDSKGYTHKKQLYVVCPPEGPPGALLC